GSRAIGGTVSDALFALDVATGKVRWVCEGRDIRHNTIAIGDGRVFFADRALEKVSPDAASPLSAEQRDRLKRRGQADAEKPSGPTHRVLALDARSGKPVWVRKVDLSGCGDEKLSAIYHDGVLVFFGVYLDGHYWQQFFAGQFKSRRLVALSAQDGYELWSKRIGYRVRPVVIENTLHVEPWAVDLHTGEPKTRTNPVTGREEPWQFARPGHHCGPPIAAPNLMLFRSYCIGYYDLVGDYGTLHFGAQRPGCWINFLPANGLVLVPEASAGCMCPFPNMCTVVFEPARRNKAWAMFSATGPMQPVKHLALNLAAPGDRKDNRGTLWLAYPRPRGHLVLQFDVDIRLFPGAAPYRQHPDLLNIRGTDAPWLFASGYRGLSRCVVPLAAPEDGTGRYTVRMAFSDPDNAQPGRRVFDVVIQGKTVLSDFDIVAEAGGKDRAIVKTFSGITANETLTVEFRSKIRRPSPEQAPILQGLEIVRERMLGVGMAVPQFELNDAKSQQTGEVRLANNTDRDFVGHLNVEAPQGFAATVEPAQIKLNSGSRQSVSLRLQLRGKPSPGKYGVVVKLVSREGQVECQREASVEYLGALGRAVIPVAEDATVSQAVAATNRGTASTLFVDGGDTQMGDRSHALTYLKFHIDVPGRPVSARLRLYNAGNPTGDSGRVCLVTQPWSETQVTYLNRPQPGEEVARIGRVRPKQVVELPLKLSLKAKQELSLVLVPTSRDGVDYVSREGGRPAELIVEYQLAR
ncbi:MAG: DNRLRE domain-containing protein, partial [Planctomycetes bacterium]|nr:DNRLRE domain-containing protein [Planctomycetota bacterium]